ncbi:MAG: hypothetical protein IPK63_16120 [Candidatus Competibacteraceae bacterium]|nr:hypothetical protein [Candidatus Competibacteraceae bacterium]
MVTTEIHPSRISGVPQDGGASCAVPSLELLRGGGVPVLVEEAKQGRALESAKTLVGREARQGVKHRLSDGRCHP